jgi:tetratricopeptide (TPR) repeat protein
MQYAAYQLYSALAANALEKLSSAGQDSARLHQVLAESLMTEDKYSQAVKEYAKALQRDSRLPGVHLGMGEALLAEDHGGAENRRKAADEFTAELGIAPDNADAAYQLGQLYYEDSDFSGARKWFAQALTLRPNFPDAHVAFGRILVRTGDEVAALKEFTLAVSQAPNNRMAHYHLAQLYKKNGRTEEAGRELDVFRQLSSSQALRKPSVEEDTVLASKP